MSKPKRVTLIAFIENAGDPHIQVTRAARGVIGLKLSQPNRDVYHAAINLPPMYKPEGLNDTYLVPVWISVKERLEEALSRLSAEETDIVRQLIEGE